MHELSIKNVKRYWTYHKTIWHRWKHKEYSGSPEKMSPHHSGSRTCRCCFPPSRCRSRFHSDPFFVGLDDEQRHRRQPTPWHWCFHSSCGSLHPKFEKHFEHHLFPTAWRRWHLVPAQFHWPRAIGSHAAWEVWIQLICILDLCQDQTGQEAAHSVGRSPRAFAPLLAVCDSPSPPWSLRLQCGLEMGSMTGHDRTKKWNIELSSNMFQSRVADWLDVLDYITASWHFFVYPDMGSPKTARAREPIR